MTAALDLVLIGRNEGARLGVALEAAVAAQAKGLARRIVYVDSGSEDGSPETARAAGAEVVELSPDIPFTAARGRNTGIAYLDETGGAAEFVQFIDGDCQIQHAWLAAGLSEIQANAKLAVVTGWIVEIDPDASLYNALLAVEWHRPPGIIEAAPGNMMVRAEAFRTVGGFKPEVIAAEDDEFCCRLRDAGWVLKRLPVDMAWHNAEMLHFSQWWRRAERSGHGFEQVRYLHPGHFRGQRLRMWGYGAVLPVLLLAALVFGSLIGAAVILAIYAVSWIRTARGLQKKDNVRPHIAVKMAGLLTLCKLPNAIGALRFRMRLLKHQNFTLIEYK